MKKELCDFRLIVAVPKAFKNKVEQRAQEQGLNVSNYVRMILTEDLNKQTNSSNYPYNPTPIQELISKEEKND